MKPPERVNLEVTHRCNLRCSFCFLDHAGLLNSPRREMSRREIIGFAAGFGPRTSFYITGGEPFLRRDCVDIIAGIKGLGCNCGVNTNGTRLGAAAVRRLCRTGLDYVLVSLHGPPAVQDAISGRRGSAARVRGCVSALAAAKAPGTEIIVTCTVTRANAAVLDQVYEEARAAGADRVIFEHLQFLRAQEFRNHERLWRRGLAEDCRIVTPVSRGPLGIDVRALAASLGRARRAAGGGTRLDARPDLSPAGLRRWYGGLMRPEGACASCYRTLVVEPDGDVRLCQLYGGSAGNVLRTDWRRIWSGRRFRAFRERLLAGGRILPGCVRCCQRFPISRLR